MQAPRPCSRGNDVHERDRERRERARLGNALASRDVRGVVAAAIDRRSRRPSIPLERLLRALLLEILSSIRSERQLVKRIDLDLPFRWFVGLESDEPLWHHSSSTRNRERLLSERIAQRSFEEVRSQAYVCGGATRRADSKWQAGRSVMPEVTTAAKSRGGKPTTQQSAHAAPRGGPSRSYPEGHERADDGRGSPRVPAPSSTHAMIRSVPAHPERRSMSIPRTRRRRCAFMPFRVQPIAGCAERRFDSVDLSKGSVPAATLSLPAPGPRPAGVTRTRRA